MAGFPGVVGAIDCTHVRIVFPDWNNAMAFMFLVFLTIAQLRNNFEMDLLMASLLVIADMHADPTS